MTRHTRVLIGLLCCGFAFAGVPGASARQTVPEPRIPSLTAAANTAATTIGEPFEYTAVITIPAGIEVGPETTAASGFGVFRVRDVKDAERRDKAGNRIRTITYTLFTFELGKHAIPEYRIRYRPSGSPEESWISLASQTVDITVNSVIVDEKKTTLQPLKPKFFIWPHWMKWLFGIGALVLIAAGIAYRRHRRGHSPAAVPPPEPAYVIALRELEELLRARLPEQGYIEEFFERLSGCVRRYMENRFHLRAPWMSTEEFLEAAKTSSSLNGQQKNSLKAFLVLSDLVKFARYGSSPKEAEEAFSAAKFFIEQTKDAPPKGTDGAL